MNNINHSVFQDCSQGLAIIKIPAPVKLKSFVLEEYCKQLVEY